MLVPAAYSLQQMKPARQIIVLTKGSVISYGCIDKNGMHYIGLSPKRSLANSARVLRFFFLLLPFPCNTLGFVNRVIDILTWVRLA